MFKGIRTQFEGRLTKDIEVSTIGNGTMIAKFNVAVDNNGKDRGTTFVDVTMFGDVVKKISEITGKGCRVGVLGYVEIANVEKNGEKLRYYNFTANELSIYDYKDPEKRKAEKEKVEEKVIDGEFPF